VYIDCLQLQCEHADTEIVDQTPFYFLQVRSRFIKNHESARAGSRKPEAGRRASVSRGLARALFTVVRPVGCHGGTSHAVLLHGSQVPALAEVRPHCRHVAEPSLGPDHAEHCGKEQQRVDDGEADRAEHEDAELDEEDDLGEEQEEGGAEGGEGAGQHREPDLWRVQSPYRLATGCHENVHKQT